MSRSVFVYAVLTTLALVGAYFSWTHEPDVSAETGVTIAPFAQDKLASVTLDGEEQKVVLEPREDGLGEYVWVSWEKASDEKTSGEEEKEATSEKMERGEFKAGETAEKLLAKMAPLKAARKLETDAKLEELGLEEAKAKLTVKLRGGEDYVLDVGDHTYGGRHYYVRDARSGDIYLMESGQLSPLEAPRRLKDRSLHGLERKDIARVEVERGGQKVTLTQHNRSDRAAAFWAMGATKQKSEVGETWLDKFFRLYPKDFVSETPEGLETVFTARLEADGDKARTIEVLRASEQEDGEERFFVRSNYTRGVVALSTRTASNVVDDVSTLFGGEAEEDGAVNASVENEQVEEAGPRNL